MKNNINILGMGRNSFWFKFFSAVAVCFLLISESPLLAAGKEKTKNAELFVSGLVRDARTKQPVSAAQISVPNSKTSAVTDDKGYFKLRVVNTTSVLNVVAYDYNAVEVPVRGKDSLVINLYPDAFSNYYKQLDGIAGVVKNSALVSSAKTVDNLNQSTAVAADEILQTALGGDVRAITRSGVAGEGVSLFIRGVNSLNASAQPLFIVDGVIWNNLYDVESIHSGFFSNPLDDIDVNDIENISVIKDGTSIYGSKASNGVILIKTKRATSMVTKISLNMFTGMTEKPGTVPMMNSEQFRVYASDMYGTRGLTGSEVSALGFLETNPSNARVYNNFHNYTDWSDEVYQKGMTQSYSISATGGDEKALYYFSLGYTGNKGVVRSTDLQRINARFNADFKLVRSLTMSMNIGFNRNERSMLDDGVNSLTSPTWLSTVKAPFLGPRSFTSTGQMATDYADADMFGFSNPTGVISSSNNNLKKYSFNISVLPTYQFLPELKLSTQLNYSIDKTTEKHFVPYEFTPARYIDGKGISYNMSNNQVMRNTAIYNDTRLTFEKSISKLNHFKAIYGLRYIDNYYESDYLEEHNSKSNSKPNITGGYEFLTASGINNATKSLSNYLTLEYDYDNRYYLTAAMALDASSRFGKNTDGGVQLFGRSWGVFPSINAAWLLSSEKFMKNVDFINFCKLRAGYGVTGNDGIKDYESMAYFAAVRFIDRASGLVLSNLANTKVQWETTGRANAGMDLGLFNDRISLNFDYFNGKTTNLLTLKDSPEISGLGKYWDNGGSMSNKGYEMNLNVRVLNLKNFKWELGTSVGHYKNEITSLPNGDYSTSVYEGEVRTAVGQPAGAFYGYRTQGVFATTAEAESANLKIKNEDGTYSQFSAGDVCFVDKVVNGVADGIIDENDKQVIGNPNPDIYGMISNKFTYKRLTLNTIFTYSLGNDVYNYYRSQLEAGKDLSNQTTKMLSRWTAEGQSTNQPKAYYGDPMGNARFSDRWIEDGSYLRLKTVTLAYEIPLKTKFLEGFTVWASANNLLTLTKYLGLDPEFSANNSVYYQGVDAGLVPLTKSYYIGFRFRL